MASSLSAIVFAAILSAYLFIGRNLSRLASNQSLDVETRRTLRQMTTDVSEAITLTTAGATTMTLTKLGPSGNVTVSYVYNSGTQQLNRTVGATVTKLLSRAESLAFTYYAENGTTTTDTKSAKSVELSFTIAAGTQSSGTLARYRSVSPRVIMRNKQVLN